MNVLLAIEIAILYAISFHQILGRNIYRSAFGIYLLLNATNLLILVVVSSPDHTAPFARLSPPRADPLVQAMVLTAIVIGFGIASWLLLLVARLNKERRAENVDDIRNWRR